MYVCNTRWLSEATRRRRIVEIGGSNDGRKTLHTQHSDTSYISPLVKSPTSYLDVVRLYAQFLNFHSKSWHPNPNPILTYCIRVETARDWSCNRSMGISSWN
jgi:hypothetical protein